MIFGNAEVIGEAGVFFGVDDIVFEIFVGGNPLPASVLCQCHVRESTSSGLVRLGLCVRVNVNVVVT